MNKKELCEMCMDYDVTVKCGNEESCKLLAILKENKKLKKELREAKKERDELASWKSWTLNPDMMGRC